MPPARRRRIGKVERAARKDLRAFPPEVGQSVIAEALLDLAAEIDTGGLAVRDKTQAVREIRLSVAQLREMAPPGIGDDDLDKQRKKRNDRMRREGRIAE